MLEDNDLIKADLNVQFQWHFSEKIKFLIKRVCWFLYTTKEAEEIWEKCRIKAFVFDVYMDIKVTYNNNFICFEDQSWEKLEIQIKIQSRVEGLGML